MDNKVYLRWLSHMFVIIYCCKASSNGNVNYAFLALPVQI